MSRPYLDHALKQINERITVERLAKEVPAIGKLKKELDVINQIMHRVSVIVQKHQLMIQVIDETGLTLDGYDPVEATREVTEALSLLRMTAVRYQ